MIRFTYQHSMDPEALHNRLLEAGVIPPFYAYRPRGNVWSLIMDDHREGVIVREVFDRLGVDYDEVVTTRC